MAALNFVVTPILSDTLANALRDSQLAAHKIISEADAVADLKAFGTDQKVALVVGCDPRKNVPFADENDDCYDIMFYTDSPDTMYRLIRRTVGRTAPCDLWLYEELGHETSMTDGEAYANSDTLDPASSVDVVDLMRHGLSGPLCPSAVPHLVNMRMQNDAGKCSAEFLDALDGAMLTLDVALGAR